MSAQGTGLLGIFGGTFNPIHLGHLRAAEQVVELLSLEKLLFVPAGDPPHKRGEALAPAALRLAWVRSAVADHKRFEVDDLEVRREGPSFTLDTVREIAKRTAPEAPVFVVGVDALREMDTWREPRAILREAHVAVMARPGGGRAEAAPLRAALPESLAGAVSLDASGTSGRNPESGTWIRWLPIDALPISATDLRRRLSEGRSVRYLVPESIHAALVESGCYAGATGATDAKTGAEGHS